MLFRAVGRLGFLLSALVFACLEVGAVMVSILLTGAFDPNEPGHAREPLVLQMTFFVFVLMILRVNLAFARVSDAGSTQWLTAGYAFLLLLWSALFLLTLLVWTPETRNLGFGMLTLACTAVWFTLLFLPSRPSARWSDTDLAADMCPETLSSLGEPAMSGTTLTQMGAGSATSVSRFGKRTQVTGR